MPRRITPRELIGLVGTDRCPHIIDVRRKPVFDQAQTRIPGAVWRDHMQVGDGLPRFDNGRSVAVYCAHGHNVSEIAAVRMAADGIDVAVLEGGIEAYESAGGLTVAAHIEGIAPDGDASIWVTRERPKIDRIACPWLIRRFIDPYATFHFVAAEWVRDIAEETGWIPYDVEGVRLSHRGGECSFDTLLKEFGIGDPALAHLARIVRGADTASLELEPEAAGLLAVSLGLSALEADDHRQIEKGMILYDALYSWCRHATGERHNWPARAA